MLLIHNFNFESVINHNANVWYTRYLICNLIGVYDLHTGGEPLHNLFLWVSFHLLEVLNLIPCICLLLALLDVYKSGIDMLRAHFYSYAHCVIFFSMWIKENFPNLNECSRKSLKLIVMWWPHVLSLTPSLFMHGFNMLYTYQSVDL